MDQPKILVAIRKRPLSKKEKTKGDTDIISIKNRETVIVSEYKQKVDLTKYIEETPFNFDFAFDENTTNQQIYESAVRPLVDSAFQGARVTCFAYGQTGSGKTYTMNGNQKQNIYGLYALGANDIFYYLNDPKFQHLKARVSYFEIYCGKLFDLLNKRQELKILEDKKNNINIIGIQEKHVTSWGEFLQLLNYGSNQRVTSQNSANSESSRSHAILQITLKEGKKIFGKISFIDLAGNQRGADHTDMKKQTRIDGAEINKSLLSLKECIRALDQGKSHTPFRGSKLTMVLKDSFIGFCRTVMIGNVAPSSHSSQNTLNTLRYADRVKELRKPSESISKEELKAREMMLPRQNKNAIKITINNDDDAQDIEIKRQEAQKNFGIKEETKDISNHGIFAKKSDDKKQREKSIKGLKNEVKNSQLLTSKKFSRPIHNSPSPVSKTESKLILPPSLSRPNLPKNSPINNQEKEVATKEIFQKYAGGSKQKSFARSNSMNSQQPKPINFNRNTNFQGNNHEKNKQINNYFSNQSPNSRPRSQFENNYVNRISSTNQSSGFHSFGAQKGQKFSSRNNYQTHRIDRSSIPNDWQGMVDLYERFEDEQSKGMVRQKLHQSLLNEENQLIKAHSICLKSDLDIIREEMNMLGSLQNDKNYLTTREYLRYTEENIDEKMSQLEALREKMAQLSYKLDTVQEFDSDIKNDDEQLLDGLH